MIDYDLYSRLLRRAEFAASSPKATRADRLSILQALDEKAPAFPRKMRDRLRPLYRTIRRKEQESRAVEGDLEAKTEAVELRQVHGQRVPVRKLAAGYATGATHMTWTQARPRAGTNSRKLRGPVDHP